MNDARDESAADTAHSSNDAEFDIRHLDYDLPSELIAQQPLPQRDQSRLLVVNRAVGSLLDARITDLPTFLQPNDLMILNDTRVLPAKFTARRQTGGKIEGLFIRQDVPTEWIVMLQSRGRLRDGERLNLEDGKGGVIRLTVVDRDGEGLWRLSLDFAANAVEVLDRVGRTPLPPYIARNDEPSSEPADRDRYQTVFARHVGSVAAPTAGLHLTDAMLYELASRGITRAFVTLHVGIGTFRPIKVDRLPDHRMHTEQYSVSRETADAITTCKRTNGRVLAIGTTSTRVLETMGSTPSSDGSIQPGVGQTDIFIYPPYRFRVVDMLLTNFHLPRSTLLALVMAFAGIDVIKNAYRHSIANGYRFFSYGDAMLIL